MAHVRVIAGAEKIIAAFSEVYPNDISVQLIKHWEFRLGTDRQERTRMERKLRVLGTRQPGRTGGVGVLLLDTVPPTGKTKAQRRTDVITAMESATRVADAIKSCMKLSAVRIVMNAPDRNTGREIACGLGKQTLSLQYWGCHSCYSSPVAFNHFLPLRLFGSLVKSAA